MVSQPAGGAGDTSPARVLPGPPRVSALERCVGVGAGEFGDHYWSQQALLSPAARTGADFTDLLDGSAIDELLSRRGLRTPFIRMAKQGNVIAAKAYTRAGGAGAGITDQVADDKVLGLLADGATLVLQALHRNWPPLVEFGSTLAGELGHPVQINSYLTPPQSQGFAAHYDTHDVFVLQVSGTKRWLIHRPVVTDPLPGDDWQQHRDAVAARAAEAPLIETVLAPGDALYLPRGFLHSAVAQGETSLHLTVGIHPVTRYNLIRQLLAEAADEPELRRSLPLGFGPTELEEAFGDTVRVLADFAGGDRLPAVARRLGQELSDATRPEPIAPLAQLAVLAALGPDTGLRLRAGLRVGLERQPAGLVLRSMDQRIVLPIEADAAMALILTGDRLTPACLPLPTDHERLALAQQLVRAAVLVPDDRG